MGTINDYTKIELQETEANEIILTRNGKPQICPFLTRVVVPGQMANTLNVIQANCGSTCPLFEINHRKNEDTFNVGLNCGDLFYDNVSFKSNDKGTFVKV